MDSSGKIHSARPVHDARTTDSVSGYPPAPSPPSRLSFSHRPNRQADSRLKPAKSIAPATHKAHTEIWIPVGGGGADTLRLTVGNHGLPPPPGVTWLAPGWWVTGWPLPEPSQTTGWTNWPPFPHLPVPLPQPLTSLVVVLLFSNTSDNLPLISMCMGGREAKPPPPSSWASWPDYWSESIVTELEHTNDPPSW